MLSSAFAAEQPPSAIHVLTINGVINPLTARYLNREIGKAEKTQAQAVVLELNTPGGLESSMREMTQTILNASIPVIVYITPHGARAASAGVFITLAGHVAAMAPGTNIGAAHPVQLGGSDQKKPDKEMEKKAVSDAAALARAIAKERGRNITWAEQAVLKSVSITAHEAVAEKVVDFVAEDREELLQKLDGKRIVLRSGTVILRTSRTRLVQSPMHLPEKILQAITDPNIAYLLLTIGFIGVIAELYSPGLLFPGIIGAICLITGFAAMGSLPISWAGLVLIVGGIALLVLEAQAPGIGLFGVAGLIAFVLGSLMLYSPINLPSPALPRVGVNPWLIGGVSVVLLAFVLVVLRAAITAKRHPATVGTSTLLGKSGIAVTDLNPKGTIDLEREHWSAVSPPGSETIHAGEKVLVTGVDGAILKVEKHARSI